MPSCAKKPSERNQVAEKKCLLGRERVGWKSQPWSLGPAAVFQMAVLVTPAVRWCDQGATDRADI